MTRGEIYDYFGRNQRRNRLGAVLRELEEQGLIRREKEKTGERGRPSERWYFCGA
jgi:predicted ArsR family transcriptional regulator